MDDHNMKERPILFSGEMVKAILAGRKTQTRRVIKRELTAAQDEAIECGPDYPDDNSDCVKCPYGKPKDKLWVRESWRRVCSGQIGGEGAIRYGIQYRADNFIQWNDRETIMSGWKDTETPMQFRDPPWKPSIHLRRSDSRLTLEITKVRVQRLQDIGKDGRKAADVIAEGIPQAAIDREREWFHPDDSPAIAYSRLWESINGKGSWEKNPYVWCLSFRRIT